MKLIRCDAAVEGMDTNVFDQSTLVLECITLAQVVQFVVEVLVDLARGTVLDEQSAENTQTTHPHDLTVPKSSASLSDIASLIASDDSWQNQKVQLDFHAPPNLQRLNHDLRWHSGIGCTLPLSETAMSANTASSSQLSRTSARVNSDGFADDEAIGDKLADGLAGIGVGDLIDLVRVEPDLALAAVGHGRRKALLCAEIDPVDEDVLVTLCVGIRFSRSCGESAKDTPSTTKRR